MLIFLLLLAVTGSGMALVLAVVMLIYGIYLPDEPQLARDLPLLAWTTLAFSLIGSTAGLASYARIRNWPHQSRYLLATAVLVPGIVFGLWLLYR